jgi:hypothetical protein
MSVTSTIVTVTASVTEAPGSSTLQQSGAFVSVGGTTLTTGTYQYCGTPAAVTALLSSAGNYVELGHMASTFFAQGNAVGVFILELGVQDTVPDGITALGTWITANPNVFYSYLCPASWDAEGADVNTLAGTYSSPTGRTYFFVTTTQDTITAYDVTTKAVVTLVPSPTAVSTEFQAAALFYEWLANNPGPASPAAPMAYRFLYGVTPWSLIGNQTAINAILTAFGNVILTGAEGGISLATLYKGTTMDGNQMMLWYAVDWMLINAKQELAATIINGSNSNPPLYYNQNGINSLLAVLNDLGTDAISFGLAQTVASTAVPFVPYVTANPSNYAAGIYNGFTCALTWQAGFLTITFNLDATSFAS